MTLIIILAVAGIMMIMAEVFLPGGLMGGIGFICLGASVYFSYQQFGGLGLIIAGAIIITCSICSWLFALRMLPKTTIGKDLFLSRTQKGYDTQKQELKKLVGKSGTTESALRPTGKVEINEDRYDAVTDKGFIEQGVRITVTGLRSNQLVVEEVDDFDKCDV